VHQLHKETSSKPPDLKFIQAEDASNTKSYDLNFVIAIMGNSLARATGNHKFTETCGNVVQYLFMSDDSPLDESIFSIDSTDYDLLYEFSNPRQFTITSDGSVDQQGEYDLTVGYYYASDDPLSGEQIGNETFLVTILAWNAADNKPPYVKEDFNDTYIIRVNEKQTFRWTVVDENEESVKSKQARCPGLSKKE